MYGNEARKENLPGNIYPREINLMSVVSPRDLDNTSPGIACSKPNRFLKFPS
jgi:hypothetical protein